MFGESCSSGDLGDLINLVISVDLLILVNFRNLLILLVILVNLVFVKKKLMILVNMVYQ